MIPEKKKKKYVKSTGSDFDDVVNIKTRGNHIQNSCMP